MVVRKFVSLPPAYVQKIQKIREELGVSSDSEVIRRAIDTYIDVYGLKVKEEGG
ncbi:putative transcriptional regulator [Archaeoglobus fulgidus DSM 8774]|uniref:Putative transcriptional regulator n=1 Tax=Archaeoglobus fulgidus DSM 8774 TaxID=1344584 RepID=A0A075WGU7_ARCFL|nr:ribbon-helix-helix protein, CopG family [Archaeoglobus fulgidus]AIG99231.1 putative transcriptional regulator [Archaeoglobus fulgidus DSM 8774]